MRAVVSVPPGHFKTETILHAIARWLRRRPSDSIAYVSYAADVAHSKSRLARDYARRAGVQLRDDSSAVHEWRTPQGGGLIATGVGGPLTGQRARLLVVDDPFANREEAESALIRQRRHEWFTSTALTRMTSDGAAIVVHTRWHPDDLAGRLGKGKLPDGSQGPPWEVVNLAAITERDGIEYALAPQHWPLEVLRERRSNVGEYDWASLFQGQPRPRGGSLFRDPARYTRPDIEGARIKIACDPAASSSTYSDYSVIAVAAFRGTGAAMHGDLLEVWRGQVEVPALVRELRAMAAKWNAPVHVESVGGFKAVPQMLRELAPGLKVVEVKPAADKFIRAQPAAQAWNEGRYRVPVDAPWVAPLLSEVLAFTGVSDPHDDQVDALAHCWNAASEPETALSRWARVTM